MLHVLNHYYVHPLVNPGLYDHANRANNYVL